MLEEEMQKFQFHFGAIKSTLDEKILPLSIEFQFHFGAIKRIRISLHSRSLHRFQFHFGAIKSVINLVLTIENL